MATSSLTKWDVDTLPKNQFNAASAAGGIVYDWTYETNSIAAGASQTYVLSTESNWFYSLIYLHQYIVLASASTDFDFEIYWDSDFNTNEIWLRNIDNNRILNQQYQMMLFNDLTLSGKIYIKITNTDASNASTFTIKLLFSPMLKII